MSSVWCDLSAISSVTHCFLTENLMLNEISVVTIIIVGADLWTVITLAYCERLSNSIVIMEEEQIAGKKVTNESVWLDSLAAVLSAHT